MPNRGFEERESWDFKTQMGLCVYHLGDDNVTILLESYYKNLFTLANQIEIEEVVQYTTRVVTDDMNSMLVGDFTRGEVGIDLKQMAPLKAPGPDEMPLIFCQHY